MAQSVLATPHATGNQSATLSSDAFPGAKNLPAEAETGLAEHERIVIDAARAILANRLRKGDAPAMTTPDAVAGYLQLLLAPHDVEVFAVMFLDVKHRLIVCEEVFRGTLTQTAVYPREVVRRALAHNAAAVILAHNHPSGSPEPSQADLMLTECLKRSLALIDVRVLDHIIVAGERWTSLATRGKV